MATRKLTDLTSIGSPEYTDVMHIVDVSDTNQDPAGSSFKVTLQQVADLFTISTIQAAIVSLDSRLDTAESDIDTLQSDIAGKQDALGFTPENVANKATNLTSPDNTKYPTTQAVATALTAKQDSLGYTPENVSNKDTDDTLSANSDTKYPSQKAVKTFVESMVSNLLDLRGNYDASSNLYPTTGGSGSGGAIAKGDTFIINGAGTLGGQAVENGDVINALVNTPGQIASNWNIQNTNITYTPENVANKDTDATMTANSDTRYPSQKAVKTALATKQDVLGFTPEDVANKSTNTSLGTSNTSYPSQNAVKVYVDTGLATKQDSLGFTPENVANKSTNTSLGTSDTAYPSQNAVKVYADTKMSGRVSSVDNEFLRSDGTGGKTPQGSPIICDDSGNVSGFASVNTSAVIVSSTIRLNSGSNDTTAGSNQTISFPNVTVKRFTGALLSVDMMPAGFAWHTQMWVNATGGDVTINHDTGATAGNRFYCPGNVNYTFKNQSIIFVTYDASSSRWRVHGI